MRSPILTCRRCSVSAWRCPASCAAPTRARSTPTCWVGCKLPVGRHLRGVLGLPVVVENDVNALAVAEVLYGHGREVGDFLVVTIGRGIGMSIVADGSHLPWRSGRCRRVRALPDRPGRAGLRVWSHADASRPP